MKTLIIPGSDPEVYKHIGPFAMNKAVIAEFEGYPILNNDEMIWFIVLEKEKPIGFASIQKHGDVAEFTNAYIIPEKRNSGLYQSLYEARLNWCQLTKSVKKIKALCTNESINFYRQQRFNIIKSYVKWHKVEKEL